MVNSDNSWHSIQYEMFCNSIKQLYDSFYKLASMSFTWNASLGAGYAVALSVDGKQNLIFIAYSLAVVGILYNFGAGVYYLIIINWVKYIEKQLYNLSCNINELTYTKTILENFNPKKKNYRYYIAGSVGYFYFILGFIWLFLFIFVFIVCN